MKRIIAIILTIGLGLTATHQSYAQSLMNKMFTPEQLKQAEAKAKQIEEDRKKAEEAKKESDALAIKNSGTGKLFKMSDKDARAVVDGIYDYNFAERYMSQYFAEHITDIFKSNVEVNLFGKTITRVPLGVCESMGTVLPKTIESEFSVPFMVPGATVAFEQAFKKTYSCAPGFMQAFKNLALKDPVAGPMMKKYEKSLETMLLNQAKTDSVKYAGLAATAAAKAVKDSASIIKDGIASAVK
jgi:hypothetical protein